MSYHIENPASRDLIQPEISFITERMIYLYRGTLGNRLESVYLLGSATRGEYRRGVSDFDVRAIATSKEIGEKEYVDELAAPLQEEFNIAKLELDIYTKPELKDRAWLQFYVVVDGLCMWGTPYEPTTPLPKTKEELADLLLDHLLHHSKRLPQALSEAQSGVEGDPEIWRVFAKRAIRLGNTAVIRKTGLYTQNSDHMVQNIIDNVPEIADSISKLNKYRKNPPTQLEGFFDLSEEAERVRIFVVRDKAGE